MAFLIHSVDDGRNVPIEYLPCSAITPKIGMALIQSSGKLAVATGANKPAYICMTEKASAVSAGDIIPVKELDAYFDGKKINYSMTDEEAAKDKDTEDEPLRKGYAIVSVSGSSYKLEYLE